ncbi:MAG: sensor histidine kinase [Myxococcota bacterium]
MRLSISTRIFIGFILVIVTFGSVCAYTIYRMTRMRQTVGLIWEEVIPVADQLKELSRQVTAPTAFLELDRPSDAHWLARILPGMEPFRHTQRIERRLLTIAAAANLPDSDSELLRKAATSLSELREGDRLVAMIPPAARDPSVTTSEAAFARLSEITAKLASEGTLVREAPETRAMMFMLRTINRTVIHVARSVSEPVGALSGRAAEDEKTAMVAVGLIASGAMLLSLVILLMIQLTLAPIRRLREGARRIASGAFDERVPAGSRDEIGQLASEFNTMAEALSARDRELARQRHELLRADRLATIGKMAAQITHEVRNPLSSIGLNTEMLEEEIGENKEAQQLLTAVQREVHRLKAITEEYLRFARLPKPAMVPLDLVQTLTSLLSFLSYELQESKITLQTEGIPAVLPTVMGDDDQLRQAFLNVARNAIEALREVPEPRHLSVTASVGPEDGVQISFTDDGPGIDTTIAHQILEPFVTGKQGGTGLGLALTQQILVDHGGGISVRSPALDEASQDRPGTCLLLTLPLDESGQVVEVAQ